jgi:hypothetical protein
MRSFTTVLLVASLLSACRTDPDKPDTMADFGDCWFYVDADGDGYGDETNEVEDACSSPASGLVDQPGDCDDGDPAIHPGADELCNGLDDDCDGEVDEGPVDGDVWYTDSDGDGWGDASSSVQACEQPSGTSDQPGDCDDADPDIRPDAPERCDGLDNDCDGDIDEDLAERWYADSDSDGYGDPAASVDSCDPGDGWVVDSSDCDDGDAAVFPGAEEICNGLDDDCDGEIDEDLDSTWYADADGDGWGDETDTVDSCDPGPGYIAQLGDCDDANSDINPDATELCNGYDDDCDGFVDDADDSLADASTWYTDADADGYGDDALTVQACVQPSGASPYGGDCDDADPAYNPGAVEDDCSDPADYNCDGSTGYVDADGDGHAACEDCDDSDAAVNPDATELCNGVDDDCDGTVDEPDAADAATWYADDDGDGYGDAASSTVACDEPMGFSDDPSDCDDADASVHPAGAESCNGVDDDCDGSVDEGVQDTFWADADGDGYGDAGSSTEACSQPTGYVADDTDCDDGDAAVSPGGTELCNGVDDDCDGSVDEDSAIDAPTWYADADGDGYGDAAASTVSCAQPSGCVADASDCDDLDGAINPASDELCNGVDDDCDGAVDEDSAVDASTWYADADGDGFGDAGASTAACSQPPGTVADASDCDDGDAAVSPAATELCNGVDDDCDGDVDEDDASGAATWYADADGDGYGDAGTGTSACSQPTGFVADATDCDDGDAAVSPAATELCNGVDDDCDGAVDEDAAADAATWYADADGDGYGDAAASSQACSQPTGFVADATDCDDAAAAVNPGATELCDGFDNDCDGAVDEDDASDAATWYADADGDGYGDAGSSTAACSQPSGYVSDSGDCDDAAAAVNPGATELCNGTDDDCDGTVDEDAAADAATWYADADGDGYGDAGSTTAACSQPAGYVSDSSDCDDGTASTNPGATEVCNGTDDDCDGAVDEASAADASTWYSDADGDGYGDAGSSSTACTQPTGTVSDATDCDDSDVSINPAATEYCNGVDDDCDGTVDEASAADASTWYADLDGDGYGDAGSSTAACSRPSGHVADSSDCDDSDAAVNPAAGEVCNGHDDDCDGLVDDDDVSVTGTDTWYQDYDLDGYGDAAVTTSACEEPSGYTDDATDCDDGDPDINPGASEACNGLDDDCDGSHDEGSVCPCAVVEYAGHPYMFCDTAAAWASAQALCWSYDYHLLTIDDASEDSWVNVQADLYSTEKWWFGFNDIASEGSWVWEDGSGSTYTNWYPSEPNDSGGDEDCAQLNRFHPDYGWNDEPCTSSFRYICEAD